MADKKPIVLGGRGQQQLQSSDRLVTISGNPFLSESDIVNNLTTDDALKPLSAAMGKQLSDLYDVLSFESVSNLDAMVVAAAAKSDSTEERYLVILDSENNNESTFYRAIDNVPGGETTYVGNEAHFAPAGNLEVNIKETELSAVTTSSTTTIAFNLAGAKILQDQIDSIEAGGSGLQPDTKTIVLTAQHINTDKYITLPNDAHGTRGILGWMDQGSLQTNAKALDGDSGAPSVDFEVDANIPSRIYIGNVLASTDGNNEAHSTLAENFSVGDVLVFLYFYTA